MSPENSALVVPPMVAVGSAIPIATSPPLPTWDVARASLSAIALTMTPPLVLTVEALPTLASTSEPEPISATDPAPAPENRPPEMISVFASAKLRPLAVTLTLSTAVPVVVTSPLRRARTRPSVSAIATATANDSTPPSDPMVVVAVALFLSPTWWASTSTLPLDVRLESEPTIASISADDSMVARATAPLMPNNDRLTISAVASAMFSPVASTVIDVEFVISPSTLARVAPETLAIGTITLMLTPPPPPPGVFAVAVSLLVAVTDTAPVVESDAVADIVASTERSFVAIATVAPRANAPTATLTARTFTECVPFADT